MTDPQIIGALAGLLLSAVVIAAFYRREARVWRHAYEVATAEADGWACKHNELIRAMHGGTPPRVASSVGKASTKLKLVRNSTET